MSLGPQAVGKSQISALRVWTDESGALPPPVRPSSCVSCVTVCCPDAGLGVLAGATQMDPHTPGGGGARQVSCPSLPLPLSFSRFRSLSLCLSLSRCLSRSLSLLVRRSSLCLTLSRSLARSLALSCSPLSVLVRSLSLALSLALSDSLSLSVRRTLSVTGAGGQSIRQ
jgi:hypothetical protein